MCICLRLFIIYPKNGSCFLLILLRYRSISSLTHDDVIKWKHFSRCWPFVRGNPRSPVNSPHKGQWSGALMFSLICAWINSWVNNREACHLRRHRAHYDVIIMYLWCGLRSQFLPFFIYVVCQTYQNTIYLLNITFIFDRCHHSVVTSVKYNVIKKLPITFVRSKLSLTVILMNGVTPITIQLHWPTGAIAWWRHQMETFSA